MGEQDVDTGAEAIRQQNYERSLDYNDGDQWTEEELDEYMGRKKKVVKND
jgi:hypothetical protein